ncbi:MAG: endopeptidase La [Acutalibacteraceae bacterium]
MSENISGVFAAVALRGMVMFPKIKIHFEVGRKKSIAAIKTAVKDNQRIFLVAQKDSTVESPSAEDLCDVGIIAEVRQIVRNPENGHIRVVVEGICRAGLCEVVSEDEYFSCAVREIPSLEIDPVDADYTTALVRKLREIFEKYIALSSKLARDVATEVLFEKDVSYLTDFIASNVLTEFEQQQALLEEPDPICRLENLCSILARELDIYIMQEVIEQRVQDQMDKNQHEYYLREQIKAISEELGEGEDVRGEAEEYKEKILSLCLEENIREKLLKECDRLSKMQSNSIDANVIRVYLDECLMLPWNKYTKDNCNLDRARKILDADHYGLEKVKERFIEMLAVRAMRPELSGQIICLVGPPGVGKTSIVRSVAKAMGRKYVRMSLGGVRDEAEIRGHRKTYVGAMPGRIASALKQAGSFNPIILLDEIDKLGSDYKGDPSSALLEVLDPEQNNSFRDNYIEFPLDLSDVLFITTANDASAIPGPLFDRMEIFELSSYTLEEKVQIAKRHLVKKQREAHGLNGKNFKISDDALRFLIDGYTREAGVRRLEQLLAALCRKAAVAIEDGKTKSVSVKQSTVTEFLGPVKYRPDKLSKKDLVGVVNGLAWTSVGGEMLQVEAVVMDGSGKLELTGNLGDVMKESARAALSFIRSTADIYGIDKEVFKTKDIHIHVPEGAVPKDGPSAGVTIATALLSALTGLTVKQSVAMTGEISLTGRVMPIGGLKEKSMAAYKMGISQIIIPEDNESDLWEVNEAVKENVEFIPVNHLKQVFALALNENKTAVRTSQKRSGVRLENKKDSGNNIVAQ